MTQLTPKGYLALSALLAGGLLLGACGSSGTTTSTPSSMLGTDSAATKVGGTVRATPADSANRSAPANGATAPGH